MFAITQEGVFQNSAACTRMDLAFWHTLFLLGSIFYLPFIEQTTYNRIRVEPEVVCCPEFLHSCLSLMRMLSALNFHRTSSNCCSYRSFGASNLNLFLLTSIIYSASNTFYMLSISLMTNHQPQNRVHLCRMTYWAIPVLLRCARITNCCESINRG